MTSIPTWSRALLPQSVQTGSIHSEQPASAQPATAADFYADTFERAPRRAAAKPDACVKQDSKEDCGEASVATVVQQLGGKSSARNPSELMRELKQLYARGHEGTTPDEMVDMLAHEGFAVTKGSTNFDQGAADAALAKGGRVVLLADALQLRPEGSRSEKTDAAHWVVLDGKDAQGNYRVRDPVDGSHYSADLAHLAKAMNASWLAHQGGGMFTVQAAEAGASEQALAGAGRGSSAALGKRPGIGSNATRFGEEINN